jgi:hypothetical protein
MTESIIAKNTERHSALAGAFTPKKERIAMSTSLSSRAIVAGAASVPVLALPAVAATAVAEPDPIFASIERWKEALEIEDVAFKARDYAFINKTNDEAALKEAADRASDKRIREMKNVFAAVATTLPGMRAKIDFAMSVDYVTDWPRRQLRKT